MVVLFKHYLIEEPKVMMGTIIKYGLVHYTIEQLLKILLGNTALPFPSEYVVCVLA